MNQQDSSGCPSPNCIDMGLIVVVVWRCTAEPHGYYLFHTSICSYTGRTPLHFASYAGHSAVVDILLHHGANSQILELDNGSLLISFRIVVIAFVYVVNEIGLIV